MVYIHLQSFLGGNYSFGKYISSQELNAIEIRLNREIIFLCDSKFVFGEANNFNKEEIKSMEVFAVMKNGYKRKLFYR